MTKAQRRRHAREFAHYALVVTALESWLSVHEPAEAAACLRQARHIHSAADAALWVGCVLKELRTTQARLAEVAAELGLMVDGELAAQADLPVSAFWHPLEGSDS